VSEPKRLSGGDDLGAALLGSARGDGPRAGSRARTAAALGLGVAAGAVASGVAGAAVGGAAKAAGASIAPKAISASAGVAAKLLWLKILAGGVVAVALAGGVAMEVRRSSNHADATTVEGSRPPLGTSAPNGAGAGPRATAGSVVPPDPATQAPSPVAAISPIALSPSPSEPVAVVNTAPQTPAPVVKPAPVALATPAPTTNTIAAVDPPRPGPRPSSTEPSTSAATAPAAAPVESPLARELRSLDDARSALGRGDASAALAELDRHDRAFPAGPLRTEARVLRAEALLARGDRAAARKIATELLARDPSGPQARRLRTIAEGAP
jgi:hypothetical protein